VSQFIPIFRLLNEAEVRYIVVGGIATILHGYVRATADVDLVVDLHTEEAQKAIRTLSGYGFKPQAPVDPMQFADTDQRARWVDEKNMEVFSLFHPDHPGLICSPAIRSLSSRSGHVPLSWISEIPA
jgi:hypothetical protein